VTKVKLYAEPNFVSGVARVLDIGATLHQFNYSDTPEEADIEALRSDWEAVGDDLRAAIDTVKTQPGINDQK
jgi:hypothetical protein